ncbi:hypothetical protein [Candidatus Walczuchella monophlebidarum]|uniref:hypothetical protein n=1 Tax=Candidatus Walczuchella monophlebidarum TaxID=1415657 RepID=UPI00056FD29C|nr:hypothetical protein [Candidatus Walczuchella monophlebidarum]
MKEFSFKIIEAIIYSLTPKERKHPNIINRKNRIASESVTSEEKFLLKQLEHMRKLINPSIKNIITTIFSVISDL